MKTVVVRVRKRVSCLCAVFLNPGRSPSGSVRGLVRGGQAVRGVSRIHVNTVKTLGFSRRTRVRGLSEVGERTRSTDKIPHTYRVWGALSVRGIFLLSVRHLSRFFVSADTLVRTVSLVDLAGVLIGLYLAGEYVSWAGDVPWWWQRHVELWSR